jgi:hypothetical protein
MEHLNIGILAHVDAGKTSLTERLLHHVGVIDHLGRLAGVLRLRAHRRGRPRADRRDPRVLTGAATPLPDNQLRATVFKIEPGVAYVRVFSGSLGARDQLRQSKVTSVRVFEHGQDTVEARA